jgi:hypothetical protein
MVTRKQAREVLQLAALSLAVRLSHAGHNRFSLLLGFCRSAIVLPAVGRVAAV